MPKADREKIKQAIVSRHTKPVKQVPEQTNWDIDLNTLIKLNAALLKEAGKLSSEKLNLEISTTYLDAIDKANKLTQSINADNLYHAYAKILIIKTANGNEAYQQLIQHYQEVAKGEEDYATLYNLIVTDLSPLYKILTLKEIHQLIKQILSNQDELCEQMLTKHQLITKMANSLKSLQKEHPLAKQVSPYTVDYSIEFINQLVQALHENYAIAKHETFISLYQEIFSANFSSQTNSLVENLAMNLRENEKEQTEMAYIQEWLDHDVSKVEPIRKALELKKDLIANPFDYDLLKEYLLQLKTLRKTYANIEPSELRYDAKHREKINAKLLISQLIRGDFFTLAQEAKLTQLLPSIFAAIPGRQLITQLINHCKNYDSEQTKQAIAFLKKYLNFDKYNRNISIFYKDSLFVSSLIYFVQQLKEKYPDPAVIQSVDEVTDILTQKIVDKESKLNELVSMAAAGELATLQIINILKAHHIALQAYTPDKGEMSEKLLELRALLAAPNLFTGDFSQNTELGLIVEQICQSISTKTLNTKEIDEILAQFMDRVHGGVQSTLPPLTDESTLNLASMVETERNEDSLAEHAVVALESIYQSLYDNIDFQDLLSRQAGSVKQYNQFHQDLIQALAYLCLFHLGPRNQFVPREALPKIKRIYHFYENMLSKANALDCPQTAQALIAVLFHPEIMQLNLNQQSEKESSGGSIVEFYIQALRQIHRKAINYVDKQMQISKIIYNFLDKQGKRSLNQSLYYAVNNQLGNILSQTSAHTFHQAVVNIKPVEVREYHIDEFYTLSQLKDYLTYLYNRELDYHITASDPKRVISEFILKMIINDDKLERFEESIEILTLMDEIEKSQGRIYDGSRTNLENILSIYRKKVARLLNSNPLDHADILSRFFNYYLHSPFIQKIKTEANDKNERFSFSGSLHRAISKMDAFYSYFAKIIQNLEDEKSRQSYTALLQEVLEGKTPTVFSSENKTDLETDSLLPETEYAPTEYETMYVGINTTMSFKTSSSHSPLEPFRTSTLLADFQKAFPWSISTQNLSKLRTAVPDPQLNLIGTTIVLPNYIQLFIIKYTIIAFDALGKVVGHDAELAMQNFNQIKKISAELNVFVKYINGIQPETVTDQTEKDLLGHIAEMEKFNQALYQNYANTQSMQVVYNEPINTFCHINLRLAHRLMGVDYQKAPLAPSDPPASLSSALKSP